MFSYIKEAQKVVMAFWAREAQIAAKLEAVRTQYKAGNFTAAYLSQKELENAREVDSARAAAVAGLDKLDAEFVAAVDKWAAPSGLTLDTPDARLFAADFPFTEKQFLGICEADKSSFVLMQLAAAWATRNKHPEWTTEYVVPGCPSPEKRVAAFRQVLERARQDLNAENAGLAVALTDHLWANMTAGPAAIMGSLANDASRFF